MARRVVCAILRSRGQELQRRGAGFRIRARTANARLAERAALGGAGQGARLRPDRGSLWRTRGRGPRGAGQMATETRFAFALAVAQAHRLYGVSVFLCRGARRLCADAYDHPRLCVVMTANILLRSFLSRAKDQRPWLVSRYETLTSLCLCVSESRLLFLCYSSVCYISLAAPK